MDYEALMDERQKHVHEHFSPNSKLNDPEFVKKLLDWITFWRRNPSRFVQRYFGITLYLYQHIILYLMDIFPSICIVAARSAAKSFIIAVYACKEAILRPGSLIVVASATKKQARLIVSEKIAKEILPRSPLLQQEIKTIKDNQNDIEVKFNNGSSIVVLVANENVRGYRATVFIYEEFRMIVKSIIDTVLSPTLFQRQIPFRIKYPDEYKELKEEPKEIYISSAWYKSHWMWDYMKLVTRDMLGKGKSVLIGMDYSIALKHEIKTRDFLVKERKKLDRVAWTIEYENQMVAENAHAYFTYDMLNKNRVLKRPFYPRKNEDVLSKVKAKHTIPKQAGEIRIVACDIAPEGGTGNDNSVFTCIRALPESKEYKVSDTSGDHIEVKQGYRRQVVYMEPQAEFETTKQAIRIKQLFADFEADYCVLDTRNAGVAIYDALAKVLYDVDRNVEYEPWTCMNDDKLKARIVIAGQKEAVFSVKASLELNSKIAVSMRDSLNNRMIELMVSNQEGVEELQRLYPEYASADVDTQLFYERPFLETVALINEMIGLEYTVQNQTNLIKIEERPGARKDRYTSVSYGNYFVSLLEADLFSDSSGYEYVTLCRGACVSIISLCRLCAWIDRRIATGALVHITVRRILTGNSERGLMHRVLVLKVFIQLKIHKGEVVIHVKPCRGNPCHQATLSTGIQIREKLHLFFSIDKSNGKHPELYPVAAVPDHVVIQALIQLFHQSLNPREYVIRNDFHIQCGRGVVTRRTAAQSSSGHTNVLIHVLFDGIFVFLIQKGEIDRKPIHLRARGQREE
jgi:hypothetical protein